MKKLLCLVLVLVLVLILMLIPAASFAESSIDLSSMSERELLQLWQDAAERLKEIGAYPYIELSKGDSGTDVTNLQTRLTELYYYTSDLTGKYDNSTIKAVKAWEKAHDIKGDGKMSIDEQDLLYSNQAIPKATPTPSPSPTPAPTPVPDHAALEITEVMLGDRLNTKVFSLSLKNHSEETIDAFTVAYRTYNGYGELLSGSRLNPQDIEYAEWWKELTLKPGKTFSMGSYFWYLFGDQTCAKIEVAISRYHIKDGRTVEISPNDYIWVEGEL